MRDTRHRSGGARAIGAYIARALDPAARARGFATTALLSEWPAIAGADLAEFTMPDRVVWPRRDQNGREQSGAGAAVPRGWKPEGAILVLRVEGPRAIEVQHRSGQILERVNTYFGYRAIAEMRILQAPVTRAAASPPSLPPVEAVALPLSADIEDEGLRAALSRLGAATRARLTRR